MNLPPLNGLLLTIGLMVSSLTFAQSNKPNTNNVGSEDTTLQYVQPSTVEADVRMITPPQGFVVSDAFNGYLNVQIGTAIIMMQINDANYLQVCDGMTQDFYTKNKLNYLSDSSFVSDNGVKGRYYKLSFELDGNELIRYMVFAGDLQKTLWLNITYPKMLEELVDEEIFKAMMSITLNPADNEK